MDSQRLKLPPKKLDRRPDGSGPRKYRRLFDHGLSIATENNHDDEESTGTEVWLGSVCIARYLRFLSSDSDARAQLWGPMAPHKGCSTLELGAGTGLASLVASTLDLCEGAHIVASDIATQMPLLHENCATNTGLMKGCMAVLPLDWRHLDWLQPLGAAEGQRVRLALGLEASASPQLVLCADLCYQRVNIEPLVSVLDAICAPTNSSDRTVVLVAQSHRSPPDEQAFEHMARARGFELLQHVACPDDAMLQRSGIAFFGLFRGDRACE